MRQQPWLGLAHQRVHDARERAADERADDVDPEVAPRPVEHGGGDRAAGLNEPPLFGPITMAAVKMKPPIATGACTPFQGAFGLVATVWITSTKRNVAITSIRSARPSEMPAPGRVHDRVADRADVHDAGCDDGHDATDQLGDPVGHDLGHRELPARGEAEGHGRVEVTAREVAEREDHEAEAEAEAGGDAGRADAPRLRDRSRDAAESEEKKPNVPMASASSRSGKAGARTFPSSTWLPDAARRDRQRSCRPPVEAEPSLVHRPEGSRLARCCSISTTCDAPSRSSASTSRPRRSTSGRMLVEAVSEGQEPVEVWVKHENHTPDRRVQGARRAGLSRPPRARARRAHRHRHAPRAATTARASRSPRRASACLP